MYLLFASAVGFVLYRCTIGRIVMGFAEKIVRMIRWVFCAVILSPLGWIFRVLKKLLKGLYRITIGRAAYEILCGLRLQQLNRAENRLERELRFEETG